MGLTAMASGRDRALVDRSEWGGDISTDIGDHVSFRTASVFLWPEESSLSALPLDAEIDGNVTGFSDSGSEPKVFALVEVVRTQIVVVPVTELRLVETGTDSI
jgi:hypothetical protein